jgi:TonB family protein
MVLPASNAVAKEMAPASPAGWEVSPSASACFGVYKTESGALSQRLERTYADFLGMEPTLFLSAPVDGKFDEFSIEPVWIKLPGKFARLGSGSLFARTDGPSSVSVTIKGDTLRQLASLDAPVTLELVMANGVIGYWTLDQLTDGLKRLDECYAVLGERLMAARAPGDDGTPGKRPPIPRRSPVSWVTNLDYPVRALRDGAEGRALIRLTVSRHGFPLICDILETTGNQDLDEATCKWVMRRASFYPARDAEGEATEGEFSQAVVWMFPE